MRLLEKLVTSLSLKKWFATFVQSVPTSSKCNVLKLRKVCERSELRLQNDPIKTGKLVTGSKFPPFCLGESQNSSLFIRSVFCKHSSLRSQTFLSFRTSHLAYPKLVRTSRKLEKNLLLQLHFFSKVTFEGIQSVSF